MMWLLPIVGKSLPFFLYQYANKSHGFSAIMTTYLVGKIFLLKVFSPPYWFTVAATQHPLNFTRVLIGYQLYHQFFLVVVASLSSRWGAKRIPTLVFLAYSSPDEIVASCGATIHTWVRSWCTSDSPRRDTDVVIDTFPIHNCFSDERTPGISLASIFPPAVDSY